MMATVRPRQRDSGDVQLVVLRFELRSDSAHLRLRREIGDEHDKTDVVRESEKSYIVRGNMDVDRLAELFGVRPEGKESATVAGLVSELAGRIPQKGEVIEEDGLRFEVLESTERRVERVRISVVQPNPVKLV